jgi:hypothetical protein
MAHSIHRVTDFSRVGPFTLSVAFSDGSRQVIDFLPVLRGDLFGPLRDEHVFNQVRLDTEVGTLVWPNDADFDPATLHDWPKVSEGLIALAESWGAADSRRHHIQMEPTRR